MRVCICVSMCIYVYLRVYAHTQVFVDGNKSKKQKTQVVKKSLHPTWHSGMVSVCVCVCV
jgi:hypothetical protein